MVRISMLVLMTMAGVAAAQPAPPACESQLEPLVQRSSAIAVGRIVGSLPATKAGTVRARVRVSRWLRAGDGAREVRVDSPCRPDGCPALRADRRDRMIFLGSADGSEAQPVYVDLRAGCGAVTWSAREVRAMAAQTASPPQYCTRGPRDLLAESTAVVVARPQAHAIETVDGVTTRTVTYRVRRELKGVAGGGDLPGPTVRVSTSCVVTECPRSGPPPLPGVAGRRPVPRDLILFLAGLFDDGSAALVRPADWIDDGCDPTPWPRSLGAQIAHIKRIYVPQPPPKPEH